MNEASWEQPQFPRTYQLNKGPNENAGSFPLVAEH